jgi:polysaccharide biosynthesis transport protein
MARFHQQRSIIGTLAMEAIADVDTCPVIAPEAMRSKEFLEFPRVGSYTLTGDQGVTMSQHQIQTYEPASLNEPVSGAGLCEEVPSQGPGLGSLLARLRRRWRIVLLIWLLLTPLAVGTVWWKVKPFYKATALVEVQPVVQPVLFPDSTPAIPDYYSYLNTQEQVVASRQVLAAALADPDVKDLDVQTSGDPVASLYRSLTVAAVPRTQLLEISIQQEKRDTALRLTRAVVSAYMDRAAGQDSLATVRRRDLLLRQEQQLRQQMNQLSEQGRQMATQAGTASDSIFELRRQGLEKTIADTRQKLDDLDWQILDLEQQIKTLDSRALPADLASQREQMIDEDAGVRWVKKEIADQTTKASRLRMVLPEDHKDVVAVQKGLQTLQTQLEREQVRAASAVDREIQRKQQQRTHDAKQQILDALAAARQKRELLQQRVDARDAEGLKVGQQGLTIKALSEQRAQAKMDYDRVVEAIKQLDTESRRPTRMHVVTDPEIRPDGIKDRRMKFSLLAAMLAMGLAGVVGLLKDLADPRVSTAEQVEAELGLRMLGAVPSVNELQSGRMTKEHFLESYRLIRASLANLGLDGNAPRSMLVTSAQAAEGKTSLAVSLAISLAEPGYRVLLIDGDIQAPQIGRLLGLTPQGNLLDVLAGRQNLPACVTPSGIGGLDVLTGHRNGDTARPLLNMRSARDIVRQAKDQYDHVVVDSPPALGAADALVWAHAVDGVIVASLVGYSDRKAVRLACQRLLSVGANVLGSVVANVSTTESYYSYSSTSCHSEGSLALAHRGGPTRGTSPLVQLDIDRRPRSTD